MDVSLGLDSPEKKRLRKLKCFGASMGFNRFNLCLARGFRQPTAVEAQPVVVAPSACVHNGWIDTKGSSGIVLGKSQSPSLSQCEDAKSSFSARTGLPNRRAIGIPHKA